MIRRTPLLTIWALSLATLILTANEMNYVFWLALTAFACTNVHVEKYRKPLAKDDED